MPRIVFICPGYENLGVEALSASLKKAGHHTHLFLDPILFSESGSLSQRILGRLFDEKDAIINDLVSYSPDLICFSVISDNYAWALGLAGRIKTVCNVPIIFGGIHPSSVPEEVIKIPFIDYVCIGEGDRAIVELADRIAGKNKVSSIKNIWEKQGDKIIRSEVRPLIQNIDELPFADKSIFYSTAPFFNHGYLIATSRGCPYECSFCCNSVWENLYKKSGGGKLRRRSVNNVIEELKMAKNIYDPKFIAFVDDTFNFDSDWLTDFFATYRKEVDLPFSCYLSPQNITEAFVIMLKKSKCFKVQTGVQSLNDNTRKNLLGRFYTNQQISEFIRLFKKHDIYLVCDNIFGMPKQDEKDMIETARFYHQNMPSLIEMFWLRYYPGTKITEHARQQGYISPEKYEHIIKGRISMGIVKGGDHYSRIGRKIQLMLNLFHVISFKQREKLINGGYKKLPLLPPVIQMVLIRILLGFFKKGPVFDLYKTRTFSRYKYFIEKKIKYIFKSFQCKVINILRLDSESKFIEKSKTISANKG